MIAVYTVLSTKNATETSLIWNIVALVPRISCSSCSQSNQTWWTCEVGCNSKSVLLPHHVAVPVTHEKENTVIAEGGAISVGLYHYGWQHKYFITFIRREYNLEILLLHGWVDGRMSFIAHKSSERDKDNEVSGVLHSAVVTFHGENHFTLITYEQWSAVYQQPAKT